MSAGRFLPCLAEEIAALQSGHCVVAGLDEAGRGTWAGPVAAGAVAFSRDSLDRLVAVPGIRDSKMLTHRAREGLEPRIVEAALAVGFGLASAAEIDAIGILPATRLAMRRAVEALSAQVGFLLIDAVRLHELHIPQKSIVKGDALCISVAAASIVAKVRRDRLMAELDEVFPGYGFAAHKGYGTARHWAALQSQGPCPIHRRTFAPIRDYFTSENAEGAEKTNQGSSPRAQRSLR